MALSAFGIALFSFRRYFYYHQNPGNKINLLYWLASGFVTLGFLFYLIPGFAAIGSANNAVIMATVAATAFNTIGFGCFFLAALFVWLPGRIYVIFSHAITFLIFGLIALLALLPPSPVNHDGVIHWNFDIRFSLPLVVFMAASFTLNIVLLLKNFSRLSQLSSFNAIALLTTFILTGFGGGYLYIGDNQEILKLAYYFLPIGVLSVLIMTLRGLRYNLSAKGQVQVKRSDSNNAAP